MRDQARQLKTSQPVLVVGAEVGCKQEALASSLGGEGQGKFQVKGLPLTFGRYWVITNLG
jgi:hypothetical protein